MEGPHAPAARGPQSARRREERSGRERLILRNFLLLAAASALLAGCATGKDPRDPWEPANRAIYKFNDRLDAAVLEPTAKAYRFILPGFVRTSVGNVFSNVGEVRNIANNTLQGKFTRAYTSLGRLVMNSTLGVLGLFDIATEAGVERYQEDFGQTLGWWGVKDGPYMVLPLFGPSSVRDTAGWGADIWTDPIRQIDPPGVRYGLGAGRQVHRRAELLDATKVLDAAALDEYQFVRDGYLQRRYNLVHDGKPPVDQLLEPLKPEAEPPPKK